MVDESQCLLGGAQCFRRDCQPLRLFPLLSSLFRDDGSGADWDGENERVGLRAIDSHLLTNRESESKRLWQRLSLPPGTRPIEQLSSSTSPTESLGLSTYSRLVVGLLFAPILLKYERRRLSAFQLVERALR